MTNRMPRRASFCLCAALCSALSGCGAEPLAAGQGQPRFDVAELDPEPAEPAGLFLVIDASGPLLVAERNPDPDWAIGPVDRVSNRDGAMENWSVTRQAVDAEQLPAELATIAGRELLLHARRGESCLATLGELELVRRTDPYERSLAGELEGVLEPDDLDPGWESPASRAVLGGRIHTLDPACDGAVWATLAGLPAPVVFASVEHAQVDDAEQLAGAALAALRALPEYAEIDQIYSEVLDETSTRAEPWEQHAGASPSFAFWRVGERTLVGVDANVGGGCGDFGASLWALFELRDGALLLRARDREAPFPSDVFDLEGDGRLELASGERLLLPTSTGVAVLDVDVPYYGCPC
jgi:hypothetical protein